MLIEPMLQRLRAAGDLESTLQVALTDVVALHGAERGSIQLFNTQGQLVVVRNCGLPRPFLQKCERLELTDGTVCARAAARGATVFVRDVEEDEAFEPYRAAARAVPFRSVLSSPLLRPEGCMGVISVHFANRFTPSGLELQSLESYCRHVADRILEWFSGTDLRRVAEMLSARLLASAK